MKDGRAVNGAPGADYYDSVYSKPNRNYDNLRRSPYLSMWARIVKALRGKESARIVDLGCGVGHLGLLLREHGFKNYTGFDFSGVAVKRARGLLGKKAVGVEDIRSDVFHSKISGKYDVLITTETLEHLDDDIGLLEKIDPVLVFFSVPTGNAKAHVRFFDDAADAVSRYEHLFTGLNVTTIHGRILCWGKRKPL